MLKKQQTFNQLLFNKFRRFSAIIYQYNDHHSETIPKKTRFNFQASVMGTVFFTLLFAGHSYQRFEAKQLKNYALFEKMSKQSKIIALMHIGILSMTTYFTYQVYKSVPQSRIQQILSGQMEKYLQYKAQVQSSEFKQKSILQQLTFFKKKQQDKKNQQINNLKNTNNLDELSSNIESLNTASFTKKQ